MIIPEPDLDAMAARATMIHHKIVKLLYNENLVLQAAVFDGLMVNYLVMIGKTGASEEMMWQILDRHTDNVREHLRDYLKEAKAATKQ